MCGPDVFVGNVLPRAVMFVVAWSISICLAAGSIAVLRGDKNLPEGEHGGRRRMLVLSRISLAVAFPIGALVSTAVVRLIGMLS